MTLDLSRRQLMAGLALSTTAPLVVTSNSALAQAPTTPTPRVASYTRRVGDAEVITLLDGFFPLPQQAITGLSPEQLARNLQVAFLDPKEAVPLPVAVHIIRQGGQITMIDSGGGAALGPTVGRLATALASVGIPPAQINRIVISHLHPDHIGGMMAGSAAAFPNASVHVSATELEFWTDEAAGSRAPDFLKPWFALARTVATAYRPRIVTFKGEADLGGGITSLPMPGHTVGHSGYRFSSSGAQLLIWGDSTAVASLQFSHLDTGFVFDTDSVQAAATRRRVLDMAATDRMLVAATHMPFPGFGHVVRREQAYAWTAEEWQLG
jgi:glyoxylase-like metal-dependent hydrolase (beta-lactamase superfamily II)